MLVFNNRWEKAGSLDPFLEVMWRQLAGHTNCCYKFFPQLLTISLSALVHYHWTCPLLLLPAEGRGGELNKTFWSAQEIHIWSWWSYRGAGQLFVCYFPGNLSLVSNQTISVIGSLHFPRIRALFFICILCFLAKHCIVARESLQECSSMSR